MANDTATASYTNDPTNEPVDLFRLRVGDTDCATAYLSDAEIRHFLAAHPSSLRAAANGARAIAAKSARQMDFRHGPISKSASQLYKQFNDLASELDRQATIASVKPDVLGITVAEKQAADEDTTAVQPDFKKGLMDNPRSGPEPLTDPNLSGRT